MLIRMIVPLLTLSVTGFCFADCGVTPDIGRFYSNGWGVDPLNQRFQSSDATSIDAGNVADLELIWAFGLDDSQSPHSYPLVTTDTVFIGSESGTLYALDTTTGCERWHFDSDGDIRTAIVHGEVNIGGEMKTLLFFGTFAASAYALDAATGSVVWQSPAIDAERGLLYFATGENYSDPATDTSDAVFAESAAGLDGRLHAFAANNGESLWSTETWTGFEAVNGVETTGGPIDVHGPMLAGDMLFITSGYQSFGQQAGNAFLAFRLRR